MIIQAASQDEARIRRVSFDSEINTWQSPDATGMIFTGDTKKVIFLTFEVAMKAKLSSGGV